MKAATRHEWGGLTTRFQSFLGGLKPTVGEVVQARFAAAAVGAVLHRRLLPPGGYSPRAHPAGAYPPGTYPPGGYPPRGNPHVADGLHFLIGGYRKGTALRLASTAPTVVDLLFVLPARLDPRNAGTHRADSDPSLALDQVATALARCSFAVHGDRDGWIVANLDGVLCRHPAIVRIKPAFACGRGYLVPAFQCDHGGVGRWRQAHPKAERQSLEAVNGQSHGKAAHLILMLKAWRRARSVPVTPFVLERLAVEFIQRWPYRRQSGLFYDWMVRDFFYWATIQAGALLPVPGTCENLVVGDAWQKDAKEAFLIAGEASALERDNRENEAVVCWRRIFGDGFATAPETLLPPPDYADSQPGGYPSPDRAMAR